MSKITLSALLILYVSCASAQQEFPLYKGEIPNSKPSRNSERKKVDDGVAFIERISVPTLTVFPANATPNGTAVLICPGGGYWVNAISHEGYDVAKKFNEMGVTAFVLKYRIPNDSTMASKETGPLQDVQEALKYIRTNASKYNVNPNKLGVMGFSAGGHLAATAGTHFARPVVKGFLQVRPDFLILIYPVISFLDSIGHIGSRDQLIGKAPAANKIREFSNELQVTSSTPPTFLVHAADDDVVKVENSMLFYNALIRNKVKAEMHLYQNGGHGFGMINPTTPDLWMDRLKNWMTSNKLMGQKE